ncbi:flagellar basal-body MS-ring/collar protein FliF [Oscillospiraceae bacterium PP1C4]
MKEQLKEAFNNAKEYWNKQSKKKKGILVSLLAGIVCTAIIVTTFLNLSTGGYKVLYPGLSSTETAQVYATLQEMSVTPQINGNGEVMVPKDQWDKLVFDLAGKGFPKSAPPYGIFLDNTGLTKTEFEKKQVLQFQLQDRMQDTLRQIDGIESAIVTIYTPEQSEYAWDDNKDKSSASVLVTMTTGYTLSPERVSAIKNLLAYSVSGMLPENVKVVDASTGVEMETSDETVNKSGYDFQRLEYEKQVQKQIEDNVKRLLAPKYGADGVTVVAKVTLDYDKTVTESKELVPLDNGNGVKTHHDEKYTLNGEVPAASLVGEQNNTDVPVYANSQDTSSTGGTTDYQQNTDYDISYIMTQIEKGQAVLKKASVSVVVNDAAFDNQRKDLLVDLISKSVDIDPSSISVTNLDFTEEKTAQTSAPADFFKDNKMIIAAAGAGLLLIIIIIFLILMALRRRSKKKEDELAHGELEQEMLNAELLRKNTQEEIEQHKKLLKETAQAKDSKENAITNEIRDFAKDNPEITASLIRSMLKEDE